MAVVSLKHRRRCPILGSCKSSPSKRQYLAYSGGEKRGASNSEAGGSVRRLTSNDQGGQLDLARRETHQTPPEPVGHLLPGAHLPADRGRRLAAPTGPGGRRGGARGVALDGRASRGGDVRVRRGRDREGVGLVERASRAAENPLVCPGGPVPYRPVGGPVEALGSSTRRVRGPHRRLLFSHASRRRETLISDTARGGPSSGQSFAGFESLALASPAPDLAQVSWGAPTRR